MLYSNINTIEELIAVNKYADDSVDEQNIPEKFRITSAFVDNKDYLEYLSNCHKSTLMKLHNKLTRLYDHFDSGHPHLHGVKTVLDNIDNFVDMKNDLSFLKVKNATIAGNGSMYDKSSAGVIPEAMDYLFNYRKVLKNEMKEKKKLLQKKLEILKQLES